MTKKFKKQNMPMNRANPIFDFEHVYIATKIDNRNDLFDLVNHLQKIAPLLPKIETEDMGNVIVFKAAK